MRQESHVFQIIQATLSCCLPATGVCPTTPPANFHAFTNQPLLTIDGLSLFHLFIILLCFGLVLGFLVLCSFIVMPRSNTQARHKNTKHKTHPAVARLLHGIHTASPHEHKTPGPGYEAGALPRHLGALLCSLKADLGLFYFTFQCLGRCLCQSGMPICSPSVRKSSPHLIIPEQESWLEK